MKLKSIKKLSGRLKYVRAELGLSQSELADMAKTTQQAIQQAEAGKAQNPRYLPLLAKQIGVPFEWLSLNIINAESPEKANKTALSAQENEFIDLFRNMDQRNRKLMLELAKSNTKKKK